MSELKAYRVKGVTLGDTHDVYIKEEADKVIAELKEQISEERSAKVDYKISANDLSYGLAKAYAENRKLKRALWLARAERALEKIAWFKLWNASISTMNPEDGARQEFDKWKKNLGKCLKKAKECK